MRVGSLFSGIGGFDLGLERAGHEIVWQVENDPYCRKVLAKHWPNVPCYEDVHDVGAHNLEEVDVCMGGFPCQPVSQAGKRLVQEDERWLWPQFARILGELRCRYAVLENVPGLLMGGGMGDVLGDLAVLGYDAEWGIVSAASVGAPHLRKRIFIVAHAEVMLCDGSDLHSRSDRNGAPVVQLGDGSSTEAPRSWWSVEPDVGRVAHGVPARVDRLRGLGNAIVPQVAELIGRRLELEIIPSEGETL
jgi:DNA (cytosine-5)-methyltransferase 1